MPGRVKKFTPEFRLNLSATPSVAVEAIIDAVKETISEYHSIVTEANKRNVPANIPEEILKEVLTAATWISHLFANYPISKNSKMPACNAQSSRVKFISNLINYIDAVAKDMDKQKEFELMSDIVEGATTSIASDIVYNIDQSDLRKAQKLINELRDLIDSSAEVDANFKRRLLLTLEKLQRELHKEMSSLDHVLGCISRIGFSAKQLGENGKPVIDRVRELWGIVGRSHNKAEGLPPPDDSTGLIEGSRDE